MLRVSEIYTNTCKLEKQVCSELLSHTLFSWARKIPFFPDRKGEEKGKEQRAAHLLLLQKKRARVAGEVPIFKEERRTKSAFSVFRQIKQQSVLTEQNSIYIL